MTSQVKRQYVRAPDWVVRIPARRSPLHTAESMFRCRPLCAKPLLEHVVDLELVDVVGRTRNRGVLEVMPAVAIAMTVVLDRESRHLPSVVPLRAEPVEPLPRLFAPGDELAQQGFRASQPVAAAEQPQPDLARLDLASARALHR
jgi:hypothetical protein